LAYDEIVVILYLFKKSKGRMSAMEISRKPNTFYGTGKGGLQMMKRMLLILTVLGTILASAAAFAVPAHMQYRMGTMEGQVFLDGKPLADVLLAFFLDSKGLPPIPGGMGKIPDSLERADAEGKFKAKLPQGSYYLGILLRGPGERMGPPRPGETFCFADDGQGKLRHLAINDFEQIDHGRIDCSLPSAFTEGEEDRFVVEGIVLEGEGGGPVAGAMVLAKKGDQKIRRPDYFSEPTGEDGKFSINLPPGGTYYLIARKSITGNRPVPGESIGKLGTEPAGAVSVTITRDGAVPPPGMMERSGIRQVAADAVAITGTKGEVVSGMDIYMYKMPDSQEIRESLQWTADGLMLETGARLNNIFFATNSHEFDERAFAELNAWADFIKGSKEILVEVGGHTDNVGDGRYNKKLSEKRAQSVVSYLQSRGVEANRMTAVGYGDERPVGDNATAEGREKNRRVEIMLIQKWQKGE
jgi:outer membrane protein OmpA-like peptidoglycan-associated protein